MTETDMTELKTNAEKKLKRAIHQWSEDDKEPCNCVTPQSYDDLDFEPQPMVGWYKPSGLIKAGLEAVISSTFGSYADKRDVQAVLAEAEWHDYSGEVEERGDIWIDYIADLGDGWNSTYTMARLLAEQELWFDNEGQCTRDPDKAATRTKRGHILVMGGDEVYPTASRKEYNNRMLQPYRCALPFVTDYKKAPHLYLVPGNHDWYDGLANFFNLFCQRRWVGGWKTWQRRSYFALKITDHLWLWAIDTQLNADIDQQQINYFNCLAKEVMLEASKIILCTAEPSWVYVDAKTKQETNPKKKEKKKEAIYAYLGHLEQKTIKKYHHEVIVGLAGDWHNYTRYVSTDENLEPDAKKHQRFVSGGGGAYLYPTHNMPKELTLPKRFGGQRYKREAIFPNEEESWVKVRWSLLFSWYPLNWSFTAFLGGFYLLLAWVVQSVSKNSRPPGETLLDKFRDSFDVTAFIEIIAHSPSSVMLLLILLAGLIAFSNFETFWKKLLHGGLHTLAHMLLFFLLIRCFAIFNLDLLNLRINEPLQVTLFGVEMLWFGGFLGGVVLGFYLWSSNRWLNIHDNEVLLCQSDPDYKNFIRMHIDKHGTLTIYPIGVERVNRKNDWSLDQTERQLAAWRLQPEAKDGQAWFEPTEGTINDFAKLIEKPIKN